jgi:hypothetical protein
MPTALLIWSLLAVVPTPGVRPLGEEVKETKCIFEELIAEIMSIS